MIFGQPVEFGSVRLLHPPEAEILVPDLELEGATQWTWMLHAPNETSVCEIFLAYEEQIRNLSGDVQAHPSPPFPIPVLNDAAASAPGDPDAVKRVLMLYADATRTAGDPGQAIGLTGGPAPVVEAQLTVSASPLEELGMFMDLPPGVVIEVTISDLR